MTTYRSELQQAAEGLRSAAEAVHVRGEGKGLFLFAVRDRRSLELARSDDGVWVEFWDGEDAPVRDVTYSALLDAVDAARDWLTGQTASE